jgi:Ndr family
MLTFQDMQTMQRRSPRSELDFLEVSCHCQSEKFNYFAFDRGRRGSRLFNLLVGPWNSARLNAPFSRFSFAFPSLQTLGEDLVTVLDYLHVKYVIGLGEGAG